MPRASRGRANDGVFLGPQFLHQLVNLYIN